MLRTNWNLNFLAQMKFLHYLINIWNKIRYVAEYPDHKFTELTTLIIQTKYLKTFGTPIIQTQYLKHLRHPLSSTVDL